VTRKLEWLDYVRDTGCPPPDWRINHDKAVSRLPAGDIRRLRILKDRARDDYLKRMDKLIYFAKHSTLMAGEAERAGILRELDKIRSEWTVDNDAFFTTAQ
jgi:hypothetical protein